MIVWILKVKQRDEYDTSITFQSKQDADEYIIRTQRHYLLPIKARLTPALTDKD